ncbi:MAG: SRPBCC domain-containing protein [Bacteroidota bacterium]
MESTIEISIDIAASRERVWDTLVNPDLVEQYMYGARTESDWKVGSELLYTMMMEGAKLTVVNGTLLTFDAPKILKHSLFPTTADYPNVPENHLHITYTLSKTETGTHLHILQEGYDRVANGEKRYQDTLDGWEMVWEKLKEVAERE